MLPATTETRVYRISPWRQYLLWIIFSPFVVAPLAVLFSMPVKRADDALPLLLLIPALFALACLFATILSRRARLELSEAGVRLVHIGYTLETTWANIGGLRLNRGSEAIITRHPLRGKAATRLGSMRGCGSYGRPFDDDEQQELLLEQRLIPIDAFGWHLRRRRLRADLVRFAPHLQPVLEAVPPAQQRNPRRWIDVSALIVMLALIVAGATALALSSADVQARVLQIAAVILAPVLAWRSVFGARNSFRLRSWPLAIFFVLMTVALLSVAAWKGFELWQQYRVSS